MIWLGLVFNRFTGMAALALFLLYLGDAKGCNAHKLAEMEAGIRARDGELQALASSEASAGAREDAKLRDEDRLFRAASKGLARCILTRPEADALNLIGE